MKSMRESQNMSGLGKSTTIPFQAVTNLTEYIRIQIAESKKNRVSFEGPYMAVHLVEKGTYMPKVGNTAHLLTSTNGYSRKACGGFYYH